jgi:hypothetical protein
VCAGLLSACGGSARRNDGEVAGQRTGTLHVSEVSVRMSEDGKKKLADNIKFDADALKTNVDRTLRAANLVDSSKGEKLEVEVTSIYIRGTFSAVMFGALAGVDNVTGNVRVLDASGKTQRSFEVSASYGFGGWGGGQDSARLNYLYEKFAELTRGQLKN